jgi:hypothetical protein
VCATVYVDASDRKRPDAVTSGDELQEPIEDSDVQASSFEDLLEFPTVYHDAADRSLAQEQLRKILREILDDYIVNKSGRSHPHNTTRLLFMPEGSGKSSLARELALHGKKIVFACKSWNQAFEMYERSNHFAKEARMKHNKSISVDLFLSKVTIGFHALDHPKETN